MFHAICRHNSGKINLNKICYISRPLELAQKNSQPQRLRVRSWDRIILNQKFVEV